MDFKQLTSFVTVARTGSFSRAAATLYISQPGISAHISALEKELGTILFERGSKPLALTEAGRELYEYAENTLKLRERMAAVGKTARKTTVHIGASTIPSAYYLPGLLCRYRRLHPETAFRITQSDSEKTIRSLAEGLFDLAFTGTARTEPGVRFTPVSEDRMVLVAPDTEEYRVLLSKKDPGRILLTKPLILREEGSASGKLLSSLTEALGIDPCKTDVVAETNDTEAIKAMVAGGMGVACVSEKAVRGTASPGQLLIFDLPESISVRKLYLAVTEGVSPRPAAADLIRFVLSNAKGLSV